jgi:CRP-like cAMP-binding protein
MADGALGKEYDDGEIICRQGERGECMYIVQSGHARVLREEASGETPIGELAAGDIFGEMAIFDKQPRSATIRAQGAARVLTLDRRAFLRRVHEDPSLAFEILKKMSQRIRTLDDEVLRLKHLSQ